MFKCQNVDEPSFCDILQLDIYNLVLIITIYMFITFPNMQNTIIILNYNLVICIIKYNQRQKENTIKIYVKNSKKYV